MFHTPDATRLRREVERRSAAPLLYLHQLPGWVVPIAFVAVLIAGLAVKGWAGSAALAVIAAFLGWFSYLSWPSLSAPGRLLRLATLTALLVLLIVQGTR
jgi:Family of unknown function (DUF6703)